MHRHNYWTPEQDQILRENWGLISTALIANKLGIDFTKSAVTGRARRIKLRRLSKVDRDRLTRHDMKGTIWTPECDQIIKDNWGKASSAVIAGMLGGNATRNSVIGRARRLGLAKLKPPASEREAKPKPERKTRFYGSRPRAKPTAAVIDAQIPFEQRKTLFELGPADCHWPVGDPGTPEFFFCGGLKIGAGPYCASHHHRAHNYVPEPTNRRSATTLVKVFGPAARPIDQWLQDVA